MRLGLAIVVTALSVACTKPNGGHLRQKEWTPLHTAADAGDVASIDRIAKDQPGSVDAPETGGHTPLHVAAAGGRRDAVARLLQHGANLEAHDVCGWTPLHIAIDNNRKEIVELLLTKGADVNAKDCRGQTPLALALKRGHEDIAFALRQRGGHE